jgi:hypothetical protein
MIESSMNIIKSMVFYIIAFLDSRTKQEDASGRKVREKFPQVPGARENNKLVDLKVRWQHIYMFVDRQAIIQGRFA